MQWTLSKETDGLVYLAFDKPKSAVNTLNKRALLELQQQLTVVSQQSDVKGLVLRSAKPSGFIYGADLHDLQRLKTREAIAERLALGHQVFDQLAAMPMPTVAMIDGLCLGGGLELALACDYRIASPESRLGFPESKLGFLPGWGGCVRFPEIVGIWTALQYILQGRILRAAQAKRCGLLDDVVVARYLKCAAKRCLQRAPSPHQAAAWRYQLGQAEPIRRVTAWIINAQLWRRGLLMHYPQFATLTRLWANYGGTAQHAPMEQHMVADLVTTSDSTQQLLRLFFLRDRLRSAAKQAWKAQASSCTQVHVIGAGTMGADIAIWCALKGCRVTLQDPVPSSLGNAVKKLYALGRIKRLDQCAVQQWRNRLYLDANGDGLGRADVIIEAISEQLEAKQTLFQHIEAVARTNAILASNTSSLPLSEISQGMKHPERLIGLHFFNPVAKMELVELVLTPHSRADLQARALAFIHQLDRLAVPVQDAPGFVVNRVLMPYLSAAVSLAEEGVPLRVIDRAAVAFGMPMGPIRLMDHIGLDVCLSVAKQLYAHKAGGIYNKLYTMVQSNHLGVKTGQGFYAYRGHQRWQAWLTSWGWLMLKRGQVSMLQHRLIMPMVQAAQAALDEGVVADADLLDAAMVFGTGFAPFRGGLMQYASQFAAETLTQLLAQYGHTAAAECRSDT